MVRPRVVYTKTLGHITDRFSKAYRAMYAPGRTGWAYWTEMRSWYPFLIMDETGKGKYRGYSLLLYADGETELVSNGGGGLRVLKLL